MTIANILAAKWRKRTEAREEAEKTRHPLDTGLPLGLRINGKIEINILLPEKAMNATFPQGAHIVHGFSQTEVIGHMCTKVILATEDEKTHSYFWIFQDDQGLSVKWFVKHDEVFPSTKEEWSVWLDEKEGLIGLPSFQLKNKSADVPGDLFDNLWSGGATDRTEPPTYTEVVQLDKYDANETETVKHTSMLYGRGVEDEVCPTDEFLLVEILEGKEGAHVSLFVGVELTPATDLKVLY